MQLVVLDAKASVGQAPDDPVQFSATSHWPAEPRHVKVAGWKAFTQSLSIPVQWSCASLSHAPPCELPVQCVAFDAKTSVGHAPDDPVHISATSHWPSAARHVTLASLKTSTHELAVPKQ